MSVSGKRCKVGSGAKVVPILGLVLAAIAVMLLAACSMDAKAIGKAVGSSSSKSAAAALENVELTKTASYLEYSDKTTDSLKLVECNDPDVVVSAMDSIDLKQVGDQDIHYLLAKGDETEKWTVTFSVRDTKAPRISLNEEQVSVESGNSFDPISNVAGVEDPVDGALKRVDSEPSPIGTDAGMQRCYDAGWYMVQAPAEGDRTQDYDVKVVASDVHGNRAEKTFRVLVQGPIAQEAAPVATAQEEGAAPAADVHQYVLNTNSKKFHKPTCKSVGQIKDTNRQDVEATRDEVISWGYQPCKNCNP